MKHFNPKETKIALLTIEQAKRLPKDILACGKWWWLRSPGNSQNFAAFVYYVGDVYEGGDDVGSVSGAVRPAFEITNLNSKFGEKVYVGKLLCTVIDKDLVLADGCVCYHRFDSKSNDWETSELKAFIESKEFVKQYVRDKTTRKKAKNVIKGLCGKYQLDEINIIDSDSICYSGSVDGWKIAEADMVPYKNKIENREVLKHMVHGRKAFIFVGDTCQEAETKEL